MRFVNSLREGGGGVAGWKESFQKRISSPTNTLQLDRRRNRRIHQPLRRLKQRRLTIQRKDRPEVHIGGEEDARVPVLVARTEAVEERPRRDRLWERGYIKSDAREIDATHQNDAAQQSGRPLRELVHHDCV